ncbi:MAG: DUF5658 family protein, partial [Candidatus Cloacimonadota bacterium]|nr:DUF5658 family protein [Candidatus Cloacimonadota bacterium]
MLYLLAFILLLFIFTILNIMDYDSTYKVISAFGWRREKNPIARFFIKKFGLKKGMLILKSILLIIYPLMIYYFLNEPVDIIITLIVANIIFILIVRNNYKIVRKHIKLHSMFK